ncbi:MAG: A/G-specific adenine glycosylase [Prevotella sp.]|jgi:A/G-specific adenine glycosylase|nr:MULTISPECIES: A/G-specific adenine glycosylase [unclassified Prevotella]MCH3969634.1 A/G-specific adenine glycosylase [Prevotella sp.]MCH3985074.1 A/G-specific adenine glycosylase [Prevotella sp.]MCH3992789.1 A/G-specific adenine glycosylase [Prevotella sp.]MCH4185870.1 A/G-specific adenine glycosylase [Prevotella sp.]MCH4215219.1 A/G-specific adenine glycosylase [Prevotella sp.]
MSDIFVPALLRWFEANGRDLPWRHTHDPYAIWLSEVILQQTRVVQGQAYWERFMKTYPTVRDLASASEDDVLLLWEGLGYYSRARNLHHAARQIVSLGHFPETPEELRKLKGIGPYTAAAVASFAFGVPVAAVDGNVYRVLSRVMGIDTPINSPEGEALFPQMAQSLIPKNRPADFNQAMMDFGATLCMPRSPRCDSCPFLEICSAFRSNKVGQLPVKLKKTKVLTLRLAYIYIRCGGKVAIHRRGEGIWHGLWEPLMIEKTADSSVDTVFAKCGGKPVLLRQGVRHVLTHRVLYADFYLLEKQEKPELPREYIWVKESELRHYAVPRLVELLLEAVHNYESD